MGCGCGGQPVARRAARSLIKTSTDGVLNAVANNNSIPNDNDSMKTERRKVEKLRRDAILRALGRP